LVPEDVVLCGELVLVVVVADGDLEGFNGLKGWWWGL